MGRARAPALHRLPPLNSRGALPAERTAAHERGSDAHYDDNVYYEAAYAKRHDDVLYYVELAGEHGGPVLEYGCGSGRITLPLAQIGESVTAVDRHQGMLKALRQSLRAEPVEVRERVTVKRGDMRSVKLRSRHRLVLCTFNTVLHLYTRRDIERFFARVHEHLVAGGRFVFDASLPDVEELARDQDRAFHTPRFRHASYGGVVRYSERFRYDALSQVLTVDMRFEPRDEPQDAWVTPLCHRQFFPQEMEALLHYNGFRLVDVHGDFERTAPEPLCESLVYHCVKRASSSRGGPR